MLKNKGFCLFKLLEKISFGIIIYLIGFFILLFDPIFYLILFFISGINIEINLLFNYSIDLILYFLHLSSLDVSVWSAKEILHYIDVRNILDKFYFLFFICVGFVLINLKKINFRNILSTEKYVKYFVLFLLLVFPFFSYFWNNIFHKYLFSNKLWIMYPTDLSFHIFNEWFFILFYLSFILVIYLNFWLIKNYNK